MSLGHVAFIGLMGSGKSTIGALVAKRLKLRFVDLDASIQARHGPIPKIFEDQGLEAFRKYEFEALCEALEGEDTIVSPGGGVVTYEPSRRFLQEVTTIYLEVSVESIVRRLSRSAVVRPLVGATPTYERVRELYEERHPYYESATFRVDAERNINIVVGNVLRLLKKR
jgi:shikimate kinase